MTEPSNGARIECLTLVDLERVALGETWSEASAHLHACPHCRTTLAEVEANSRFLSEFAAEIAANAAAPAKPPPVSDDPLPELAGYRILGELQRGGQGIVYRAIHESTGRAAAVKVVRAGSWRRRARMEREAQVAAALRHPNIVTLHHCGEVADGRYAIAMELVEGLTLDAWSRKVDESASSPRERLRRKLLAFAQICDGVQHAHQHGVIHRDLKPANILVDADDAPRILDFGVARRTDPGAEAVTATGELACTLGYASPEQVASDPAGVDSRTDIYSLGVVLYEMFTGKLPMTTDGTVAQLVRAIADQEAPLLSSLGPLPGAIPVDADLETIVATALAKSPDRRYRTAAALKDDIEHYLSGEAIDARRDSRLYVLRKALWRNRRLVVGASLVAATIVVATIATVVNHFRTEAERDRAANEGRRQAAVSNVLRELMPRGDPSFTDLNGELAHRNLRRLSDKAESLFANDPETAAAVRMSLGDVCMESGALRFAEVEFRTAVRMLASRPNPRDAQLAAALDRLAELLMRRRTFAESERRCDEALALRRELFGEDHADVAASLGTLARIRLAREQLEDAADAVARAERICVRAGHAADRTLANVRETKARILMARDKRAAALEAIRDSLALTFLASSDLEPETTRRIAVLSECTAEPSERDRLHGLSERLARAEPRDVQAEDLLALLALKASVLGDSHPDFLETMTMLAGLLTEQKRFEEALDIARRERAVAEAAFGSESMALADALEHEAVALYWLDREAECITLLERRLELLRPLLTGKDDLYLAIVTRELGATMARLGRRADAEHLYEEAARTVRERCGDPHRELAWCIGDWGRALDLLGDPIAGEANVEEALKMLASLEPVPQWHAGMLHCMLARIKMSLNKLDEAQHELDVARAIVAALRDDDVAQVLAQVQSECDEMRRTGSRVRPGTTKTSAFR